MVFPNKGENHASGVANEKEIVKFMNKNPENAISEEIGKTMGGQIKEWNHEGGTQQKMDASARLENGKKVGVSLKKNKRKTSTFDHVNTTKGIPYEEKLKAELAELKTKHQGKAITKKTRAEFNDILSLYLNKLNIATILSNIYKKEDNTNYIIFNRTWKKEMVMIHTSNLIYFNLADNYEFILKSTPRAKTSRQIWIKSKDGNEVNTHLRIRLVLNNGVTALLGKSKKNKSSVPCMKIQQDNVDGFINKCFGKVIVNY